MTSEVIVDVTKQDISIALLEDKRLVEFQREGRSEHFSVGNIYLAKVRKLMPGLNACFVNVGYERDAFLHYLDLGTRYKTQEKFLQMLGDGRRNISLDKVAKQPEIEKEGTIQSTLKVGQEILVQIVKEPISTKGPRLTSELIRCRASSPKATHTKHQAQRIWCNNPYSCRGYASSRVRQRDANVAHSVEQYGRKNKAVA